MLSYSKSSSASRTTSSKRTSSFELQRLGLPIADVRPWGSEPFTAGFTDVSGAGRHCAGGYCLRAWKAREAVVEG